MPVATVAAGAAVFGARLSSATGILQALKKRYTIPRMCLTSRNSSWPRTRRERGRGDAGWRGSTMQALCSYPGPRATCTGTAESPCVRRRGPLAVMRDAQQRLVYVILLSVMSNLSLVFHLWVSGRIPGWLCVLLLVSLLMVTDRRFERRRVQSADYRTTPEALWHRSPRCPWFVPRGVRP